MLTEGGEATRELHVGPGPLVAVMVTARPLTTPATSAHPRLLLVLQLLLLLLLEFTLKLSEDQVSPVTLDELTMALVVPGTIDTLVTVDTVHTVLTVVVTSHTAAMLLFTTTLLALGPKLALLTLLSCWLTNAELSPVVRITPVVSITFSPKLGFLTTAVVVTSESLTEVLPHTQVHILEISVLSLFSFEAEHSNAALVGNSLIVWGSFSQGDLSFSTKTFKVTSDLP